MKNARKFLTLGFVMLISAKVGAAETQELSLFGTLTASAYAGLGGKDAGTNGTESELRLVMEGSPEEGLSFRAEGGYKWTYGLASTGALIFDAGLAPAPAPSDLPPGTDLHRAFFLDQAWASAVLGSVDFRAGIIPVGWGTAYLYNPTSRTAAPGFPGENIDILSGKPGFSAALALPAGFSLEAYALADGRNRSTVPALGETDSDTFPFGGKFQFRSDFVDASFSYQRELASAETEPKYWYGADMTGIAGPVTLYAEGAVDFNDTEVSAGFSGTVPFIETVVRGEYIRLSSGAAKSEDYDTASFLSGTSVLLAGQYFFASLEKEDAEAARWKVSAGGLLNLADLSAVLTAEMRWIPRLNLELSVFGRWFTGTETDEFGGSRLVAPGVSLRPYRGIAGLSAKWSF